MSTTKIIEIPYHPDSVSLFEKLLDYPYPVFLDSGHPYRSHQVDIISASPYKIIQTHAYDKTSVNSTFNDLRAQLLPYHSAVNSLPFSGGAIGYLSYDFGKLIEEISIHPHHDITLPLLHMGIYDWAIITDHLSKKTLIASQHRNAQTKQLIKEIQQKILSHNNPKQGSFSLASAFQSNISKKNYIQTIHTILKHIRDGNCYQINFAQRFSAQYQGSPWEAYKIIRKINPAPFAAYLPLEEDAILSFSPERFLKGHNKLIEAKPIKGTRSRDKDPTVDKSLQNELINSSKDRAENLMIVDLLRNDLSKTCETGTVKVPTLFELESYPSVHHLVSTVTGILGEKYDLLDLIQGSFPGGSITGAPKHMAMQLINDLEPHARSLYCGSIGYLGFDGNMDFNIAIRTLLCNQGKIHCYAGGGIVADSCPDAEFQETIDKVEIMLKSLRAPL